jgi:hypothetical protein
MLKRKLRAVAFEKNEFKEIFTVILSLGIKRE